MAHEAARRTDGTSIGSGSHHILRPTGSINVYFERDTNLEADDAYLDAIDWFGQVLDDVNDLAGRDDVSGEFNLTHLPLLSLQLNGVVENTPQTWHSLGRFHTATCLWTWGDA